MKQSLLSKFSISFFILFSLYFTGFAQSEFKPGYIITTANDTITGFINYRGFTGNTNECIFKANLADKSTVYNPSQILAYRFQAAKYYVSSSYINFKSASPVFLEYLIKGKINLFQYRDNKGDHFVVSKDTLPVELENSESRVEVNGTKYIKNVYSYKGQLKNLMSDRADLFSEIDNTKFDASSLLDIVRKYNESGTASYVQFEAEKQANKVRFGLYASYGKPTLFLNSDTYKINHYGISTANFITSSYYTAGFVLDIQLLEVNDKLHIMIEPGLAKIQFGSDVTKSTGTYNRFHNTIDINISALRLPLSLKYAFSSSTWKTHPFLRGGITHYKFLKKSIAYTYLVEEQSSQAKGTYSDFNFSKYQNALFLAVGTDLTGKKHKLTAELLLEGGDGIYSVKYKPFIVYSRTSNLMLQLAYVL